jgi:hypothetical protein
MIRQERIIIFTLFAGAVMSLSQKAMSQADTLASVIPDTLLSSDQKDKHTLYSAAGYGSNMIYLGSTISQDNPYGFAALSYSYKSSLYLTFSAIHLANYDPYVAFYTGSLGYSHTFNSWFDISVSGSRYQVAPRLRETLFNNFWYGDLTLGVDWKILYTKLSAGWLYTTESSMYYQVKNSRYFNTPSFFRKRAWISFDPYVNILFGTLSTIESNTDTVETVTYPFYQTGSGTSAGSGNGNGHGSGSKTVTTSTAPVTTAQTVTTTVLSKKFGIMEIDMGIPVAFNTDKFIMEIEPGYTLPMFDETYFPGTKGFVFMLNCYIKIF